MTNIFIIHEDIRVETWLPMASTPKKERKKEKKERRNLTEANKKRILFAYGKALVLPQLELERAFLITERTYEKTAQALQL